MGGGRGWAWAAGVGVAAGGLALATAFAPGTARANSVSETAIIGHRGGTDYGPESTLATFAHAIAVGAQAIEFDVRFSRDGVPVVIHDETLDRTTNCTGALAAKVLASIEKCDAGNGEHVPTLEQALDVIAVGHIQVFVHCKEVRDDHQARAILDPIDRHGLNDGRTATTMADTEERLTHLEAAGSKRLGLVFDKPNGWDAPYPVLIAYNTAVTRELVKRAQSRGKTVIAVQDHLTTLNQLLEDTAGLDGFMANTLDDTLEDVGRYVVPPGTSPQDRPDGTVQMSENHRSDNDPTVGLDGA